MLHLNDLLSASTRFWNRKKKKKNFTLTFADSEGVILFTETFRMKGILYMHCILCFALIKMCSAISFQELLLSGSGNV
jgi:hypothetical protein